MSSVVFAAYSDKNFGACMGLFDANCPKYFAPNERADYAAFLGAVGPRYTVVEGEERILAAFGVLGGALGRAHLNWILVAPEAHGGGIGRAMMAEAARRAKAMNARVVDIGASQFSAPFFARFGAVEVARTQHGWGPDMHKIDMEWVLATQ
jgi:GNAT superfamily N-acetyltransferase